MLASSVQAQQSKPSFQMLIDQADTLHDSGDIYDASEKYLAALASIDLSTITLNEYPSVIRALERAGYVFYLVDSYNLALQYFWLALDLSRELPGKEQAYSIIPKLANTYKYMRMENVSPPPLEADELETAEVYYKIIGEPQYYENELYAFINAGLFDGLYSASTGSIYGSYNPDYPDRLIMLLGSATIDDLDSSQAIIKINPLYLQEGEKKILKNDMAQMLSKVPRKDLNSIFWDLAIMQVLFHNINNEPIYDYRMLLKADSPELEEEILEIMRRDVYETWVWLDEQDDGSRSEMPNIFLDTLTSGRFQGKTVYEAMKITTNDDIRSFLGFVKVYPAKYMGIDYKINETYATWIINNCPIGFDEFFSYLMNAQTKEDYKNLVSKYYSEITNDEFFVMVTVKSEKLAEKIKVDEALNLMEKCKELAEFIDDKSYMGRYFFSVGRVYDIIDEDETAAIYYEKAIPFFIESNYLKGLSHSLNNIGAMYQNKQQYIEALNYFNRALDTKLKLMYSDSFVPENDYLSIAKTYYGIGRSHYFLANYSEAIKSYEQSIIYCLKANNLQAKSFAASVYTEVAKVHKKKGEFDLALNIYETQLLQYTEIGDDLSVADTYDNIAYINFDLGNYQKAYDTYYEAYEIKMGYAEWDDAGYSMSNCGQAMWNLGDLYLALTCHNIALELRKIGNSKSGQAYSISKIASLYNNLGQPEVAEKYYHNAFEIYKEVNDSIEIAAMANTIGNFYYDQKNFSIASDYYHQARRIYEGRNFKSEMAGIYKDLGDLYLKLKNYSEAGAYYSKALNIRREIDEKQNIMYSLIDYSLILLYSDFKTEEALVLIKEALELAISTGSKDYQAYCYQSLGDAYSYSAKNTLANENYRKALSIYESIGDVSGQCTVLRLLGANEISRGEFAEAFKLYNQALGIANEKNLRLEMARTYNNLTEFYYYTGDFNNAFKTIEYAHSIFEKDNNLYGIANTHVVEGNTFNLIGNASDAMKYYLKSDSIYVVLEDPISRATVLNNMATIAYMQGDYDKSLLLLNKSLNILDSVGLVINLKVTVTNNLGELYMEKGIWEEAEFYLSKSIELAQSMQATRYVWQGKTIKGKLRNKQGRYRESIDIITECYQAYLLSDEKMAIAECATILGKNYYSLKEYDKAKEFFNLAIEVNKSIGSVKMLWEPLYQMALVYRDLENNSDAIAYLKEAVGNIELLSGDIVGDPVKKKLFAKANNKKDIYETLISLLVANGEVKDGWVYQEKLNVFGLEEQTRGESIRGAGIASNEEVELAQLELKKDGIYNQLLNEKSKPIGERSEAKIAELERMMSIASDDYQNFFWDMVEKGEINNDFANTVNPEDLDAKRFNMDDDIVVIQYLITENKLIAFVAANDTLGAKVIDISKHVIENYVNSYYFMLIGRADISNINAASEQLYNVLIEPIKPLIKDKVKIAVVPGGILVKLPFQSLGKSTNTGFKYFGELHKVFYINDMNNTVIEESLKIANANLLAFGNADNTLPYAEKEVDLISNLVKNSTTYIKSDAMEDIAKNHMNNYQIVHFATHGVLDPVNFRNTYLTMAPNLDAGEDGLLTMNEINRIRTLRNCQLIVLSACNTAINDEKLEGWINNPAKAFLRKGAKTAIASLWAVDDAATGELMSRFYRNLLDGQNKIEAITNAQRDLMKSDKFSHPYYWAAFELIGQWK